MESRMTTRSRKNDDLMRAGASQRAARGCKLAPAPRRHGGGMSPRPHVGSDMSGAAAS
eukprot:CAMPEP_0204521028 /NCGR_PEP_ID=MMETSP0661-20131031/5569_1 /ASSEMBLY_ACC=CAM_ASM_000606 /TAXON_ID=109239 /ORGANISM="Alexandrium margalefi, Strain AMGDE01CS-322" /LENGTH=57 /DNA_ID=CAMNT_0051526605 /DNA_START=168 /DNA_END=338 /DNA_ORIENTATION=+